MRALLALAAIVVSQNAIAGAGPDAARFAQFVLSPAGQAILKRHGFTTVTSVETGK
jgi:ABC-type molybdate transport system substrate-binding protein